MRILLLVLVIDIGSVDLWLIGEKGCWVSLTTGAGWCSTPVCEDGFDGHEALELFGATDRGDANVFVERTGWGIEFEDCSGILSKC